MDKDLMTLQEICDATGAREPSVKRALEDNNLRSSRLDFSDRRRLVYPKGSLEQVKEWLMEHASEKQSL